MKLANVVEARDVRSPADDVAYSDPARRSRIEGLLRAYPGTTDAETNEIVQFLAHGMHMDVGLIAARDEFKEKVASLRRENRAAFRLRPLQTIMFILLILVPVALLAILPQLLGRS